LDFITYLKQERLYSELSIERENPENSFDFDWNKMLFKSTEGTLQIQL
jgi:hypothetical protein